MKQKDKGRLWWWGSILVIAVAAILAGYFWAWNRVGKRLKNRPFEKAPPPKKQAPPEQAPMAKGPVVILDAKELKPPDEKTYCERIEQETQDYFKHLNRKGYVRHLSEGLDTYAQFKTMVGSFPPGSPSLQGRNRLLHHQ